MKKITLLLVLATSFGFAQVKSTGVLTFVTGLTAELSFDSSNSIATLTLTGPSDRWFAFKLGSFTTAMSSSPDGVYYNGSTLIDGNGGQLNMDTGGAANQNWTVTSNTVNAGSRTIVATRAFNTGQTGDYVINFADTTIDVAAAFGPTANSFTLENHGSNREKFVDAPLTTLGAEDFSLKAANLYPNPTKGLFTIDTITALSEINIYSHVGQFVKSIKVENTLSTTIDVADLQTGVYLLELKNDTDKSWKKIVVE